MKKANNELDENYWTNRYIGNTASWDIGYISTPLKDYVDQLTNKDIAILIPGCGNAYEAAYLLAEGFTNITVIDISPIPVKTMQQKFTYHLGKEIKVLLGDFFELNEQYDLIIEQTFFCALSPSLRESYALKMTTLLNNGGKLVGLFFNAQFETSPPFGGDADEYVALFSPKFSNILLADCYNSIDARNGRELFAILVK